MQHVEKLVQTYIEIDTLKESSYRRSVNDYNKELINRDQELSLTLSNIHKRKEFWLAVKVLLHI